MLSPLLTAVRNDSVFGRMARVGQPARPAVDTGIRTESNVDVAAVDADVVRRDRGRRIELVRTPQIRLPRVRLLEPWRCNLAEDGRQRWIDHSGSI